MGDSPFVAGMLTVQDLLDHLGGIDPGRVQLWPMPGAANESDLIASNDRKQGIFELVDGVLVRKATDYSGSSLGMVIACSIRDFIIPRNLGLVSGSTGLLRLGPNLIRSPNVAFVLWDRIPDGRVPTEPIPTIVPTLAIEVRFPENTPGELARKRREYFAAGVHLVWEVDPSARTVAVFNSLERPVMLAAMQILYGGDVLPGFALPLAELFAELDRQGA